MSTARPISFAPRVEWETYESDEVLKAVEEVLSAVFEAALHADRCPGLPRAVLAMIESLRCFSGNAIEKLCEAIHDLTELADVTPALPASFAKHVVQLADLRLAVLEAQDAVPRHSEIVIVDAGGGSGDEPKRLVPAHHHGQLWNGDMTSAPRDGRTIWAAFKSDLAVDARRPDLALWSNRQVPVVHAGLDADGIDLGWALALPISAGTFHASAFCAWRWPSRVTLSALIPKI